MAEAPRFDAEPYHESLRVLHPESQSGAERPAGARRDQVRPCPDAYVKILEGR